MEENLIEQELYESSYLKQLYALPYAFEILSKKLFRDRSKMEESLAILKTIKDHFINGSGIDPKDDLVKVFILEDSKSSSIGTILGYETMWNIKIFNKSIDLRNGTSNYLIKENDNLKIYVTDLYKGATSATTENEYLFPLIIIKLDPKVNLDLVLTQYFEKYSEKYLIELSSHEYQTSSTSPYTLCNLDPNISGINKYL